VGEPDQPAPAAVRAAAVARVESGDVRYTPAAGTPGLRRAIAEHLSATRGVTYIPEEITVCHSAKHALSGTLMALVQEGDEVLVPLPAWASYFDLVRVTGAEPVKVAPRADGSGRPDADTIRAAITPRTRVLMFNSPNNPSGHVWSRAEVTVLAELALEHDLWLLSDEIYRALVYEGEPAVGPVEVLPEVKDRTAIIDGASKRFAMTGYRIGFVAGPRALTAAVAKLHSQMAGSPNTVGQAAYERALVEEPPEVEEMRLTFARRRALLIAGLKELGLRTPDPRGAFYAFPDVSPYLDERGSVGFCEDLLEDEGVALVPGSAFGMDAHVRISYAAGEDKLGEGLRRLGVFLRKRAR
jgi:aspartate aminotransferase